MDDCCNSKQKELTALPENQKIVLKVALFINLAMFVLEFIYGTQAKSTSLLADSLDMLGDSIVYGVSLYAIGKSVRWNGSVSLAKGLVMAAFGFWVIGNAIYRFLHPALPIAETMGWVGTLALIANLICAIMLLRFRNADINMRSTWLCSRNDVIANVGVLIAAELVAVTGSQYPDLFVGGIIASLVLHSAYFVLTEAFAALKTTKSESVQFTR